MELVELTPLRLALVGLPGVSGLSTEQRKRLTVAVELVANPSIIFMDEPTSGLDARAAAIVMRTVRNTVDTGRTVVCTIHQPSIDIFEAFDEVKMGFTDIFVVATYSPWVYYTCWMLSCRNWLVPWEKFINWKLVLQLLLMQRGGRVLYAGPLGHHSQKLIDYFEAVEGVPKIKDGINPSTWMLEVTSQASEQKLDVNFADIYTKSALYQWVNHLSISLSPYVGSHSCRLWVIDGVQQWGKWRWWQNWSHQSPCNKGSETLNDFCRCNEDLINQLSSPAPGVQDISFPTEYAQPFWQQCLACLWKQRRSYWRNPYYNVIRIFLAVLYGCFYGTICLGFGHHRYILLSNKYSALPLQIRTFASL